MFKKQTIIIFLYFVSGCASIVSGTQQSLFIDTPAVEGASCQLNDSKGGSWYLANTPGSVTVSKGNGPMNIVCRKIDYKTTSYSLDEDIAGAVLGNVILGGGVGIFIDAATGAAQKYPDKATVWMEPIMWESDFAKEEWLNKKVDFEAAEAKAKAESEAANSPPPSRRY